MHTFESDSFDIVEYLGRDSVDNLDNVQNYLDFSIESTIKRQFPDADIKLEKDLAKKILIDYLNGNNLIFTRQNDIRRNMTHINRERVANLLIKTTIEKKAFNDRVRRTLTDENFDDKCVTRLTELISSGNYELAKQELQDGSVLNSVVGTYVNNFYKQDEERRKNIEYIAYEDQITERALQTLNIDIISNSKTR